MNKLFKKSKTLKKQDLDDKAFSASVVSDTNTDTNTVDQFTRSASVYDPNASVLSEESFLSENFDDVAGPQLKGQRKMIVKDAKFVDKDDWKKNPDCNVCRRKMDKMKGVNRHHCRLCAAGVCGECSKKRVNSVRVCDICFFKQKTDTHEKRREEYLNTKAEELTQDEKELHKKQAEAAETKAKLVQIQADFEHTQENINKGIQTLEKTKEDVYSGLAKHKKTGNDLRDDLDKCRREIRDREERLRNIKTKLSVLKLQISQKKALIENKLEELDNLKTTKSSLEHRTKNPTDSFADDQSKGSFVSTTKNYSLVSADKGKGKGGKYNISLQPVNI